MPRGVRESFFCDGPPSPSPCSPWATNRPSGRCAGKIVSWLKSPGDKVAKGESIVVSLPFMGAPNWVFGC